MTAHRISEAAPAIRAAPGGFGSMSQMNTRLWTCVWKTQAFTPASTSMIIFRRKKMFWYERTGMA